MNIFLAFKGFLSHSPCALLTSTGLYLVLVEKFSDQGIFVWKSGSSLWALM